MILVKTEKGHQVLKDRSVRITPRQRSAFILFDGKRSVGDVLESGMGIGAQDIDQLVDLGLLAPVGSPTAHGAGPGPAGGASASSAPEIPTAIGAQVPAGNGSVGRPLLQASASGRSNQQRYKDAYPIATRLSGSLGLRGFRLNLAVEGTSTYEELLALAPRIRAAVGPDKAAELDRALDD